MRGLLLLVSALLVLTLAACDSSGSGSEPDPPAPPEEQQTVTISARTETEGGDLIDSGTISFDGSEVASDGTASEEYEQSGGSVEIRGEAGGYVAAEQTVTRESDRDVTLTLAEDNPANVSLSFEVRAASGDSLVSGDVTFTDSLVAEDVSEATVTLPYGEASGDLCFAENDFFGRSCAAVTPDRDQSAELAPERKSVALTAATVDSAGGAAVSGAIAVEGDTLSRDGTLDAELPKRRGMRRVTGVLRGYRPDSTEISASEDADVELALADIPACSDGIDNDGDGLVDVWEDTDSNGIPTEGDTGDPGCTEPSDDNETHRIRTIEGFSIPDDTSFVSSDPDHWNIGGGSRKFESSVAVAVGNIYAALEIKVSSSQNNEAYASRFSCGSITNITEIVEDDPSVDGWYTPVVLGIKPAWFQESTDCDFRTVHKAFVNDNPGEGGDDVIFGVPGRQTYLILSWAYEPDHPALNGTNATVAETQTTRRNGRRVRTEVTSEGYAGRQR